MIMRKIYWKLIIEFQGVVYGEGVRGDYELEKKWLTEVKIV